MALPTTTRCEVAGTGGLRVRVWAAGDVTGTTHTHASHYQADVVAANILGRDREADYSAIPRCVFTTPSVFAVGTIPGATEGGSAAADTASPDPRPGSRARERDEGATHAADRTGAVGGGTGSGRDAVGSGRHRG